MLILNIRLSIKPFSIPSGHKSAHLKYCLP